MPAHCLILVPVAQHVEPACEEGLRALEARGYPVRRVRGYANIDQARSQMATDALAEGFSELMWIDADVGFHADDVERLRAHGLPLVCGIYVKKGARALACHVLPGTEQITFGKQGGLVEIMYAATGFLHTRREVYERMQQQLALPTCNQRFERPIVPYFLPLVVPDSIEVRNNDAAQNNNTPHNDDAAHAANMEPEASAPGENGVHAHAIRALTRPALERRALTHANQTAREQSLHEAPAQWYLGEDYAFCHRARECGYKIMADTTIRLRHYGPHGHTWEDAGADPTRYATYVLRLT